MYFVIRNKKSFKEQTFRTYPKVIQRPKLRAHINS